MLNELNISIISIVTVVFVVICISVVILNDLYNACIMEHTIVDGHRREHIIIMSILLSGYIWFTYAFLFHNGLQHSIDIHLLKEKASYGLIIMDTALIMLSMHLYREVK